jgi:hypothetical protein
MRAVHAPTDPCIVLREVSISIISMNIVWKKQLVTG